MRRSSWTLKGSKTWCMDWWRESVPRACSTMTGCEALLLRCLAAAPQMTEAEIMALPGLPLRHLRKAGRLHATLQDDFPEAVPPARPLRFPVELGTLELPFAFVRICPV